MTIKQAPQPELKATKQDQEEGRENKPLLNITLPAPPDGNPSTPVSYGSHNNAAQKNFKQVADLLMAIINNQKLVGMAVTEQDKKIKMLEKTIKETAKTIRELAK